MTWESANAFAEIISAVAVVASLVYLAKQVTISNRLTRAEAYRAPNSDLISLNATFSTIPEFNTSFRSVILGASRDEIEESGRATLDAYLISITDIYEQLTREVREGVLGADAFDNFGGKGLFDLLYYRSSWPLYREYLSSTFVEEFEKRYHLHGTRDASW